MPDAAPLDPVEQSLLAILGRSIERLQSGFAERRPIGAPSLDLPAMEAVLGDVAVRMRDNFPYFHPLYAGQMLKPPHPVARLAYALAMVINPNNHALDGGRASSAMEKEAVASLAAMFGWTAHLGHLTGGGTMANLEALWIAGQLRPGTTIVASDQAHYTHGRISGVLGLRYRSCPTDRSGRMDLDALDRILAEEKVGTVVATMGTTAIGAVDPLPALRERSIQHGFRLHADAAYGGYFTLAQNLGPEARAAFGMLTEVDSLVIDPHKHGLQPYGCGCILFRDPAVGRLYRHDSPYTYFSSAELHLGEISLECSRPGAAAVALWATQRLLPLVGGGEFAAMLEAGREAALELHRLLRADPRMLTGLPPELDIVIWAPRAGSARAASLRSRGVFEAAARRGLDLALAELPVHFIDPAGTRLERDQATVTCLRSVLMKPEHREWVALIAAIIGAATDEVN
jgi:glutamate/tyrosine decarboxylase-like PLP-dependent enzyme